MVIGRLISPIHSLGPGNRVGLWTQGCSKRCEDCISPDLQSPQGTVIDNPKLAQLLIQVGKKGDCTGLTVSGGEPFEQSEALLEVLLFVRSEFQDILVYTGYTLAEIRNGIAGQAGIECLKNIDVLIDGRYKKELNTCDCVLRGSQNQVIHYLNSSIQEKYAEYMRRGRIVENFVHNGQTVITGILNRGATE